MSDQLLPCAHCGSPAAFMQVDRRLSVNQRGEYIDCTNKACGATSALMFAIGEDAKPLLAERWNRRALSQQVLDGWQPIETAPKDGTSILLARKKSIADGFYSSTCWAWPYINKEPTHWMPLPAAPRRANNGR